MSAKPNISQARWADQGGANIVEPGSTERDAGFQPSIPISSGRVNALFFHHYEWDKWLDDGDCAFHNLSATGTLGVTGASTLAAITASGLITASAGIVVPTGQAVALNGTATLTVGTGAATFGGLVNANAGIAVPTGQTVVLNGTTSLNVGGDVTINGTLHEAEAWHYQCLQVGGNVSTNVGNGSAGWDMIVSTGAAAELSNLCTIPLNPGDVITGMSITLFGSASAGSFVSKLTNALNDGSHATLTQTVVNPPASYGTYVLDLTATPYTVPAANAFVWHVLIPLTSEQVQTVGIRKKR